MLKKYIPHHHHHHHQQQQLGVLLDLTAIAAGKKNLREFETLFCRHLACTSGETSVGFKCRLSYLTKKMKKGFLLAVHLPKIAKITFLTSPPPLPLSAEIWPTVASGWSDFPLPPRRRME